MIKQNKVHLSVIIPCFNESANISELVSRIDNVFKRINLKSELIFIDDKSLDDTVKKIKYELKKNSFIRLIENNKNIGMARSWKRGLEASSGKYVALIDADLQYQPEDILRLYKEITFHNIDIVQGYRSTVGRLKDSRFFLSKGLNFLLNLLFSMALKDNKSGFIVTRREVLKDIFLTRFNYKHFQTFLLVSAFYKKYFIKETEVLFLDRLYGNSFIKPLPIRLIFDVAIDLIKGIYEFRVSSRVQTIISKYISKNKISRKSNQRRSLYSKIMLFVYFHTMPLHAWILSRNVKQYFKELNHSQWLSRADILSLQLEKLKKLITHCYYHNSYYRELFDKNKINPDNFHSLDDLKKIPFLTKEIVSKNINYGLLSNNHDKKNMLKIVTSGSTGVPFTCYADKFQLEMRWAATLRSMEWTGYRFGDRCARLWHQTIGMSKIQIIKEYIDALISRRIFIPAYSINDNRIKKYMRKLFSFKPVLIDGYAESFNFLANYLQNFGEKINFSPKAVMSSAQILPSQSRKIIENEFSTKVYDKYGSREFSGIAYESGEKDIHLVVAENYIVEILKNNKDAKPGEIGEVVVTDLNNYCMPFIRYKIGDLALAVDKNRISKCGRGLPLIGRIEGRVQAIIIGSNGNYIPGTFFAHFFKEYPEIITQYQIIQNKLKEVDLLIIKGPRFYKAKFDEIIRELKTFMGLQTRINIKFVKNIAMVRTGKHQGAVSNIKLDFQAIKTEVKK